MQSPPIIENGKIQGYPKEFHIIETRNTLELRLILPGINKDTLFVKVDGDVFICQASYSKDFKSLFRRQKIQLKGTLPFYCEPHSISAKYKLGVFIITLAKDLDRRKI